MRSRTETDAPAVSAYGGFPSEDASALFPSHEYLNLSQATTVVVKQGIRESCNDSSNVWTVLSRGREIRRPGLRVGSTGGPPGGGASTVVALVSRGTGWAPDVVASRRATARRHPSADSPENGRHGIWEQPRSAAPFRATSVTPTPSPLDAQSPGAGTAPLPATKLTCHVATWT